MKFVWAFLIITASFIPFLIGGGYGFYKLLQYCAADSGCRDNEVCRMNKCIDACSNKTCGIGLECYVENHNASCRCVADDFVLDIHMICRKICSHHDNCSNSELCKNHMCYDSCHNHTCDQNQECIVDSSHNYLCKCLASTDVFDEISGKCIPKKSCRHRNDCALLEKCVNDKCTVGG